MATASSVYAAVKAALTSAGVAAYDGPAEDLPVDDDGLVAQAAVLWPSRLNTYTRMNGHNSGATDRQTIICVGATTLDALAVADKVEAAIGGLMLSPKGGTLQQVDDVPRLPEPEPNADPVRVSLAVEYAAITKG